MLTLKACLHLEGLRADPREGDPEDRGEGRNVGKCDVSRRHLGKLSLSSRWGQPLWPVTALQGTTPAPFLAPKQVLCNCLAPLTTRHHL